MSSSPKIQHSNIFLRMYPLQRGIVSLLLAGIAVAVTAQSNTILFTVIIGWIIFSFSFLLMSWIILFTRPVGEIKRIASLEDGSKLFVSAMILVSSFAGMVALLLLMLSRDSHQPYFLPVAIAGMLLSWMMVHTVFTFHYAHKYYDTDSNKTIKGGLQFPEENNPDYLDFAYFSFVIGCTFQVSDVTITSRNLRRLVLLHGLLAFGLNTFVVALTINLVAGLR